MGEPDGKALNAASTSGDATGWLVITSYGQKVVAEYQTRQEAEDAAEWHQETYGGPTLEVCRAS